ncbi:MAG: hypothetical protein GTO45_41565 [Candidatus Aminicenantes bacterium]|nr:hypothetical protein [Candidatus Aminicenantes bacterium]NIM85101.1 hypothetical protein [Candidatus Aminicenantes bacterium]NIN24608.1 hypothetical protein [Candidatus Aminicenantes bacterium]NIN48372.1 hypothetical protein [Candidatus Aminicenantes bacterium]NIN91275.1 hypothetical protein [Candidatus Aminicenantes bacterium]
MLTEVPGKKVWKRTTHFITLEPVDAVVREIVQETSWTEECICEKLFGEKILIRIPGARYHIYRDCLG